LKNIILVLKLRT